jgi:hypothetical protein
LATTHIVSVRPVLYCKLLTEHSSLSITLMLVCLPELPYRVVIFPSRKSSAATTSANSWVAVSGTLGETSPVPIPRGALELLFRVSTQESVQTNSAVHSVNVGKKHHLH